MISMSPANLPPVIMLYSSSVIFQTLVDQESGCKNTAAFGTIDILINNAGILRQNPISETSDEEWNAVINTNLKGPFLLTREVLPTFEKHGRGKIVNIASIAGIIGYENLSPYCASKGGIIAMTRALAIEFAPKRINVNCICPGAIKTGMTKMIEENETMLKQTLMSIPAGRMGNPIDIANAPRSIWLVMSQIM